MRAPPALLALALLAASAPMAAAQDPLPPAQCMAIECHPLWPVLALAAPAVQAAWDAAGCALDGGCLVYCMSLDCWPPGSWLVYHALDELAHAQDACGRDPSGCTEEAIVGGLARAAEAVQAHWPQCALGLC